MKRPPRTKPMYGWSKWPQSLAPNVRLSLYPWGRRTVFYKGRGRIDIIYEAAGTLSERTGKRLDEIVVFVPRSLWHSIYQNIWKKRRRPGGNSKYKGLIVSTTPRLTATCMAFLIKDVEEHRTPADAYYVILKLGKKRLKPDPLYTAEENAGVEIHK